MRSNGITFVHADYCENQRNVSEAEIEGFTQSHSTVMNVIQRSCKIGESVRKQVHVACSFVSNRGTSRLIPESSSTSAAEAKS